jgi:hypothetical protein
MDLSFLSWFCHTSFCRPTRAPDVAAAAGHTEASKSGLTTRCTRRPGSPGPAPTPLVEPARQPSAFSFLFCFEYCKDLQHILTFQSRTKSLFSNFSFSRQLLNNFNLISKLGGAYSFQRKCRVKHKQFMVQEYLKARDVIVWCIHHNQSPRRLIWGGGGGGSLHPSPSSATALKYKMINFTVIYEWMVRGKYICTVSCDSVAKLRCLHRSPNVYTKISMPLPEAPLYSLHNKTTSLVEMPLIFPMIQGCLSLDNLVRRFPHSTSMLPGPKWLGLFWYQVQSPLFIWK